LHARHGGACAAVFRCENSSHASLHGRTPDNGASIQREITVHVARLHSSRSPAVAQPRHRNRRIPTCAQHRGQLRQLPRHERRQPGRHAFAGRPIEGRLVRKMQDFKAGRTPSTIMTQLAKGYTDEQIDIAASFFAAQKP
jgi:cytochrome c553